MLVDVYLMNRCVALWQAPAQRSAAYVLGCVHTRLWNFHGALCASNGFVGDDGNSRVLEPLGGSTCAPVAIDPLLHWVADFPQPQQFHSAQYTRLLLGVANTCVTILFNLKQYEVRAADRYSFVSIPFE